MLQLGYVFWYDFVIAPPNKDTYRNYDTPGDCSSTLNGSLSPYPANGQPRENSMRKNFFNHPLFSLISWPRKRMHLHRLDMASVSVSV